MNNHPRTSEDDNLQKRVMTMVLLNAFATPLMLSASNVALPAIGEHFSLTAVMLSWIPLAYLMASAMFILIFGRIADGFGRKRLFLIGTTAVIVTSVFTALSSNGAMLISGRFLQGVSAAMLYATQMAIVSSVFPPERRGKAIGMVVATVYVGLATGPLLGGVATDWLGWRANFLLHVPLACLVLLLGLTRVSEEWHGDAKAFDLPGSILFAATIACLCLGVSFFPEISSLPILLLFVAGLVTFTRYALHKENPIWDIRLFFNNPIFTRSCGASMIMYTATYANTVLVSLYLQQIKAMSASMAGLILMTQPATMALLSPMAGSLSDRIEPRILATAGMLLTAVGLFFLSLVSAETSTLSVVVILLATGVGFSLFSSPNANAIMGGVGSKDYGSASAAMATTRILGQLGSMVLVAFAMAVVIGDRLIYTSNQAELAQAIHLCFLIAAAICVPGIFLSASRGRLHDRIER